MLVGLSVDDTTADLEFMVRKLLSVRVFDSSDNGLVEEPTSITNAVAPAASEPRRMWAKSVVDVGGEILCGKVKSREPLVIGGQIQCPFHAQETNNYS